MSASVAVVAGGSGGIGAAIATALAVDGAKVCLAYLTNEAKAHALAATLSCGICANTSLPMFIRAPASEFLAGWQMSAAAFKSRPE